MPKRSGPGYTKKSFPKGSSRRTTSRERVNRSRHPVQSPANTGRSGLQRGKETKDTSGE